MIAQPPTPSLERYLTPHRIAPELHSDGRQFCATDGIRVYTVTGSFWLHDQETIRRLRRDAARADLDRRVAAYILPSCYRCGRTIPKGTVEDELSISVNLGTRIGLKCSYCQDKDVER